MAKKSNVPKILLDCDVIIHFIKAGKQLLLTKIFPERFVILDKVKAELEKHRGSQTSIDNFIEWSKIPILPMPRNITCGCGVTIQLTDNGGSVKKSVSDINKSMGDLEKMFKRLSK